MNVKKLVQVSISLTVVALVALLPACAGGKVDVTTCSSVRIGDSRADVDSKLGSDYTVSKGTNGTFAIVKYTDVPGGVKQCCTVTFDSESTTATAIVNPAFDPACK